MKKLNKFFAVLVALAMMATLCVSMAFAENTTPYATAPEAAKLTKYLQAGTGVDKPGATYNFVVTPTNGGAEATDTDIAASEMAIDANGDYIGNLTIADMFKDAVWTKAGEYLYTVTEGALTNWNEAADANDTLSIDSDATYTLHVYVKNGDNGPEIDKVTVEKDGQKVDPNPENPPATADDGEDKGFSFTNVYTKDLVVDPSDPTKGALNVDKEVAGEYGDKTYDWSFKVDFTTPEAYEDAEVTYKVIDADGAVKVAEKAATGNKIEETLKDGWKIVVTKMPQGTTWKVTEDTSASTAQNAEKYVSTIKDTEKSLTGKGQLVSDEATLTETNTSMTVVNTLDDTDVTPTGILISNLPYIALALVAIGGLVAYVVVRRRNADEA